MRTTVAALAIVLLLFAPWIPSASAQKSEEGLLAAWEQAQKADPNTLKFERVKDHQYHFATKRFPFDGDLLVRNGVVGSFSVNEEGISMGTVEVELQGLTDNFDLCPQLHPVEHHKHFVLESADSGVADLGEILSAGTRPHSRPRRLASADGLRITRHFCADLVRLAVQPGAVQPQTEGHQSAQRTHSANLRAERTNRGAQRANPRTRPEVAGSECQSFSGDACGVEENVSWPLAR